MCLRPAKKSGNVKRVLITGMSGVGQSSLLHELAARGYRTVDTGYGAYFQVIDGERLWREGRISVLLASAPGELPCVLFVQGTTRNQVLFYPRFDHIVLLSAPPEVLAARLAAHHQPLREDPAELAEALHYQQTVEPLLRASATLEVVTTVPVTQVADIVLDHVLVTLINARDKP
jgi:dephospho-CoA kinase